MASPRPGLTPRRGAGGAGPRSRSRPSRSLLWSRVTFRGITPPERGLYLSRDSTSVLLLEIKQQEAPRS